MTSKGQVTIPKKVRDLLALKAGSAVDFRISHTGEVVIRPAGRRGKLIRSRFAKLRGRATVRMRTDQILALTRAR